MATKIKTQKPLALGSKIAWVSQSQGSWKEKLGTIVAFLPKGERLERSYAFTTKDGEGTLDTPKALSPVSQFPRVVVAVVANPRTGLHKLYVPLFSVLDRDAKILTDSEFQNKLKGIK